MATDSLAESLKQSLASETGQAATDVADEKAYKEALKNNPLIVALGGLQNGNTPVLGVVASKDTARVMSYFRMPQISRLLPRDLKLSWTVKPQIEGKDTRDKSDRYGLIALKVTSRNGQAPLSGNVITDARVDFDQTTNKTLVSMKMNSEGAASWARLTKANIGRAIAISLDNYIYSYPAPSEQITGGESRISGRFTPEEAKALANVLNSGKTHHSRRRRRSFAWTDSYQQWIDFVRDSLAHHIYIYDDVLRIYPGSYRRLGIDSQYVLYARYTCLVQCSAHTTRYCRYSADTRYGGRRQRAYLRTLPRRVGVG